jgi:hypothetical protein
LGWFWRTHFFECANAEPIAALLGLSARWTGMSATLKQYSAGVEVCGRGPEFDPRTDTIGRVHARRLRKKLEEYYTRKGEGDPVIIEVPQGHYIVEVRSIHSTRQVFSAELPRSPTGSVGEVPRRAAALSREAERVTVVSQLA